MRVTAARTAIPSSTGRGCLCCQARKSGRRAGGIRRLPYGAKVRRPCILARTDRMLPSMCLRRTVTRLFGASIESKSRPKAALFIGSVRYQAAFNVTRFLRRYPKKPSPAKPKIIIAQVDGSGTAEIVALVN
jgi:hypothetical protein